MLQCSRVLKKSNDFHKLRWLAMINFIVRAVWGCVFLFLTACTHQTLTPQVQCGLAKCGFATCQKNCESRVVACNKTCRNNCQQCNAYAKEKTAKSYYRYQHERYVKGEMLALELNSFRDPLQCRKTTCNCRADYQVCMQACGGVIHKRLQVTPACC